MYGQNWINTERSACFMFCFAWQRRLKSHWFPTTQVRSEPRGMKSRYMALFSPPCYGGASSGMGLMGSQCGIHPLVSEHTYSLTVQPINIHEATTCQALRGSWLTFLKTQSPTCHPLRWHGQVRPHNYGASSSAFWIPRTPAEQNAGRKAWTGPVEVWEGEKQKANALALQTIRPLSL